VNVTSSLNIHTVLIYVSSRLVVMSLAGGGGATTSSTST